MSRPRWAALLLIAAGIFQWTPLKDACLEHCRSPMSFLMHHWREGLKGAALMGLHHGGYCLGCCWLLMALLFVLGVMNLPWVAALTIVVLAEKTLPQGRALSRGLRPCPDRLGRLVDRRRIVSLYRTSFGVWLGAARPFGKESLVPVAALSL